MNYDTREYQQQALQSVRNEFKNGCKKVILTLPTGAGKSFIALLMIIEAIKKNKRIAFCVDRLTLLDQIAKVIYDAGIEDFGIMQSDNPLYKPDEPLQLITAQTLARRKTSPFDLFIYDEAHVVYKSVLKVMKEWDNTYFVGLTATPFTRGLAKYWQSLVNGTNTAQLIKDGFLSEYIAYGPSKPDLRGVTISAGDYNKKMLAERTDKAKLIGDIVEHWLKIAHDRQTVVGAVNVAHAEHIAEKFKEAKIKADVIHCYLKPEEIKERLNAFRNGDIQILSSVDLISRGFDMPQVGCVIAARPTKSLNYHLQFLGRGLRVSPDNKDVIILDHAGNIERLGFPDDEFPMVLNDGKKKEQKKREKKEKLPKPCPKCSFLKITQECPICGFVSKKQANVVTENGDLVALQKGRHKQTSPEDKEKLYAKLLAGANCAGFKDGWAANQYRNYFGVWPAKKVPKDDRFYSFLSGIPKHRMMKIIWGLANNK